MLNAMIVEETPPRTTPLRHAARITSGIYMQIVKIVSHSVFLILAQALCVSCSPAAPPNTFSSSQEYMGEQISIDVVFQGAWSRPAAAPRIINYGTAVLMLKVQTDSQVMDIFVDREDGEYYQFSSTVPLKNERIHSYHTTQLTTFEMRSSRTDMIATSTPIGCGASRVHIIVRGDAGMSESEFTSMLSSISLVCSTP